MSERQYKWNIKLGVSWVAVEILHYAPRLRSPRGSIYGMNSTGPRRDPWGTPHEGVWEFSHFIRMNCFLVLYGYISCQSVVLLCRPECAKTQFEQHYYARASILAVCWPHSFFPRLIFNLWMNLGLCLSQSNTLASLSRIKTLSFSFIFQISFIPDLVVDDK